MRPDDIEAAITDKTAAIVIVHVLGGAVDMTAVTAIGRRHGLWVFEDTCESLGVSWEGRSVGTFGQMGSYSFYFSHHITTIEGGMVVTDDDEMADLMRAMRAHGWVRHQKNPGPALAANPGIDPRYLFITTGFNLRPTEINAAIGLEQLKRLDDFNARRRQIATALDRGLAGVVSGGRLQICRYANEVTPAPFGYPVLCRSHEERNAFRDHLEASGIETRPIICGNMARQPAMKHIVHRVSGSLAGADRVMDCGIYWGTHPMMQSEEIDYITTTVNGFYA
jgi:CDP-4-dehydro-6-deoxyglucose reductase, E1